MKSALLYDIEVCCLIENELGIFRKTEVGAMRSLCCIMVTFMERKQKSKDVMEDVVVE